MKILSGIAAIVMLLSLSACGGGTVEDISEGKVITNTIQVPVKGTDRTVTCLVYTNEEYEEGGFSCNWEAFNQSVKEK